MRISGWSSDVCSSDLDVQFHRADMLFDAPGAELDGALVGRGGVFHTEGHGTDRWAVDAGEALGKAFGLGIEDEIDVALAVQCHVLRTVPSHGDEAHALEQRGQLLWRSEEHTSELQSLMRISYAVFCLKKKTYIITEY